MKPDTVDIVWRASWQKESGMPVESCIPIIPSANLEKSLRLWVDGLGFSMSSEMQKDGKLILCMLRKDELRFMPKPTRGDSGEAGRL